MEFWRGISLWKLKKKLNYFTISEYIERHLFFRHVYILIRITFIFLSQAQCKDIKLGKKESTRDFISRILGNEKDERVTSISLNFHGLLQVRKKITVEFPHIRSVPSGPSRTDIVLSSPARRVPVGRWRQEPDRLQKRLRFEKSERELEGKEGREKEWPEITGRSWTVKTPGRIAEYGRKHSYVRAPGNKSYHREMLQIETWKLLNEIRFSIYFSKYWY